MDKRFRKLDAAARGLMRHVVHDVGCGWNCGLPCTCGLDLAILAHREATVENEEYLSEETRSATEAVLKEKNV